MLGSIDLGNAAQPGKIFVTVENLRLTKRICNAKLAV